MAVTKNNFDFLRLLAAVSVIIGHAQPVRGNFLDLSDLGSLAVYVFFSISGFLVAASWERDPHAFRFLSRRVIRIFPGLIVVVAVAAFIVGPLTTTLPLTEYLQNPRLWFYLRTGVLWPVSYNLPGVFASNHLHDAVNASLWTLPDEILMYISLAILGTVGVFKNRYVVSFVCLVVIISSAYKPSWNHSVFLADFVVFWVRIHSAEFAFGVLLWTWRRHVPFHRYAWIPVLVLIGILHHSGWQAPVLTFAVPYAAISFALNPMPIIQSAGRFGDFSYGVYIYGFLVEQTIMHLWPQIGIWEFIGTAIVASVLLGACSWHLIEHPAMRLKDLLGKRRAVIAGVPA